jgi:hypothetical protein
LIISDFNSIRRYISRVEISDSKNLTINHKRRD